MDKTDEFFSFAQEINKKGKHWSGAFTKLAWTKEQLPRLYVILIKCKCVFSVRAIWTANAALSFDYCVCVSAGKNL